MVARDTEAGDRSEADGRRRVGRRRAFLAAAAPRAPHWTQAYLGIPYTPETDCAALVERVLAERFGVAVVLPSERRWEDVSPREVHRLAIAVAVPSPCPREGDMALMRTAGARGEGGAHVGLYALLGGRPWILHSTEGAGSHLTPLSGLAGEHLAIVGYYRHRSQGGPHHGPHV